MEIVISLQDIHLALIWDYHRDELKAESEKLSWVGGLPREGKKSRVVLGPRGAPHPKPRITVCREQGERLLLECFGSAAVRG